MQLKHEFIPSAEEITLIIQNEIEKIKVWDYILTWMDTYIKFT